MEFSGGAKARKFQNCHFPRIERKFQWNEYQKVFILIPANSPTALPCLIRSPKIPAVGSKMNCIKFGNDSQYDNNC